MPDDIKTAIFTAPLSKFERLGHFAALSKARTSARALYPGLPILQKMQNAGDYYTLKDMANALNEAGIPAPRSGDWNRYSVRRACIAARRLVAMELSR